MNKNTETKAGSLKCGVEMQRYYTTLFLKLQPSLYASNCISIFSSQNPSSPLFMLSFLIT